MSAWQPAMREPVSSSRRHPWLAKALFTVDVRLRRQQAVFEYSDNPSCIFRIHVGPATRPLVLRDGTTVGVGQRIVRLHYWNEQMPPMPREGANVGWGRQIHHCIAFSLRELARYLSSRPDLAYVNVIYALAPSLPEVRVGQALRIMARYGFEMIPEPDRMPISKRIDRIGENILTSLLQLALHARAFGPHSLRRVWVPLFVSRRTLEERFGLATDPTAETRNAP